MDLVAGSNEAGGFHIPPIDGDLSLSASLCRLGTRFENPNGPKPEVDPDRLNRF